MAVCEVCGNDYELSFEVVAQGARHTFDSFECAIHRMAPICEHCGVKVVGQRRRRRGTVLLLRPLRPAGARGRPGPRLRLGSTGASGPAVVGRHAGAAVLRGRDGRRVTVPPHGFCHCPSRHVNGGTP